MTSETPKKLPRYADYATFWPFYLLQHAKRTTRRLHIAGTFLALTVLVCAVFGQSVLGLVIAPVCGYGLAWVGHCFVEKNRPATFTYPLWSLRGDFHMFVLWIAGRLEIELAKHNLSD